jgi:2-dehydro-3-deoxygalactonokinase
MEAAPRPDRIAADWIAADWGGSRLRVWAMGADGAPLAEAASDAGMTTLSHDGYAPALLALVDGWLRAEAPTPVVVCGMAGAREGWAPAGYAAPDTPIAAFADDPATPEAGPRLSVRILRGLRQDAPPDVMRGEETQIAGLCALRPGFEGLVSLPGTHGKWAVVRDGRVTRFRTFLTGELFDLLSRLSVLRHGMGATEDDGAFDAAVAEALDRPAALTAALFSVRARGLMAGQSPEAARGRLSGLLIGAEIAAAADMGAGSVTVVAAPALAARHARALAVAGRPADVIDGAAAARAGLALAHARLFGD